eukprot:481867-Prymnesium_polylepis.2
MAGWRRKRGAWSPSPWHNPRPISHPHHLWHWVIAAQSVTRVWAQIGSRPFGKGHQRELERFGCS